MWYIWGGNGMVLGFKVRFYKCDIWLGVNGIEVWEVCRVVCR